MQLKLNKRKCMWLDFPYAVKKKKKSIFYLALKGNWGKKKISFPAQEKYCIG